MAAKPGLWSLFYFSFMFAQGWKLACEQTLHLEDIVKSTHARGDATAGSGGEKGELAPILIRMC